MVTDEPTDWHDEYTGLLDDFKIYPTALSAAKIAYIASDGTGIFSVQSIANLIDDEPSGERAVNFRDFGELAGAWLEQKLWPE